jgi:hypothetical protein
MKKFKVKVDCFCEGYLHEKLNYPRKGLIEKKLLKDDIVEFKEEWSNFYGSYIRVVKDGKHYDMLRENLLEESNKRDLKITVTLTKEEWSWVNTWIESAQNIESERISKSWFEKLLEIVKPQYESLYFSKDYSTFQIPHDSEHSLTMDRPFFSIFMFCVGRIAYDFNCKTVTTQVAYNIIQKLEAQGDEDWKQKRI